MATRNQGKARTLPQQSPAPSGRRSSPSVTLPTTQAPIIEHQSTAPDSTGEDAKKSQSVEFMLKEYERLNSLRMDEVKQSEQRVTFFLTIASAAIGLIVLLAQASSFTVAQVLVIARIALIILLLFGINILNRMNARIVQLRTFDLLMAEIRSYFRNSHPEIGPYFDKHDKLFVARNYRFSITTHILRRLRGTLIDLIVLSDSLICGGIAFVELYIRGYRGDLLTGLTTSGIIISAVLLYAYYYYFMRRLPPFGIS